MTSQPNGLSIDEMMTYTNYERASIQDRCVYL